MTAPASDPWERLAADLATTAILTDFDGTLSEIVADPATAEPLPGAVELLEGLAARAQTVAVVSGRPLEFLEEHFGAGVTLAGLYGLEVRCQGVIRRPPEVDRWRPVIEAAAAAARRELPERILVEPKGLALTVHYRTDPDRRDDVEAWARRRARETGLVYAQARCSVELNPPIAVDKGTVVASLVDPAVVKAACYLGDDRADLAAFAALRRLAIHDVAVHTVAVHGSETPDELLDAADQVVEGPRGAVALLSSLVQRT